MRKANKKNFFKQALCVIVFIGTVANLSAQSLINNVDTIAGEFVKSIRKDKSEKVTVETNKWYYAAGEDVWLKAWVTNKVSNKFYTHSQNLYLDIVDKRDSAIAQLLLHIPSEHTEGYIRLSDSIPEGNYWLRAFTSTMFKNDLSAIFVKPLYIVNPKSNVLLKTDNIAATDKHNIKSDTIINFYPEGATVITGTNNVFGIKAVNEDGKPIAIKGYITDNQDSTAIVSFNTDPLTGLGKTSFYIGRNKTYTAHIKLGNRIQYFRLPNSNDEGGQISIKQETNTSIRVVIAQGDSLYKKGVASYLIGLSKDSICFAGIGKDMYELAIPKSDFPAGEAKLLLVNDQRKILSERSVYISNSNVKVITDKANYGAREKITMDVLVGDSLFHPMFSALSVSITDDSIVKEPVYEQGPLVALSDNNIVLNDLIMLTKKPDYAGKYIYDINSHLKTEDNISKDEIEFETIQGTVKNKKKVPMPNRIVTLYTNKKINLFDTDTTDANGKFSFKIPLHYDSIPFTLQVSNLRGIVMDEKIAIEIRSTFPVVATPIHLKQKLTPQQTQLVSKFKNLKLDTTIVKDGKEWLKDVIVKTSIKNNSYNTTKRVSSFSQVITGEAIQKMTNTDVGNAILMIPGLHLKGGYVSLGGVTSFSVSAKDEPLLIVDGIMVAGGNDPATDTENVLRINSSPVLEELTKIPVDIIDFVEVLKGPEAAFYGTRSSNGVIIVNTHRVSNFRNHIESYGSIQYNSKSYHLAPNFTAPDYSNLFFKSSVVNDNRATLYWNGHLYTNANGKATVSFYTGDRNTNYTVKITGVTVTGELIEKQIKINRN